MAVMLESPKRIVPQAAEGVHPREKVVPRLTVLCWITVAIMGVLYLSSFTTRWWWTPDSALYLMLKNNLVAGEGFTLWGFPHLHVPPGFPLLLAMLEYVGLGTEWGRNLFMIGIGLGTIWVTYRVLLRITSPEMALLITAAFGYSHAMHFNTIRVLSDVPCMFFLWLGLWCWFSGLHEGSKKLELGTLCFFIACSMRVAAFPLALGASAGLVFQPANVSRLRLWLNAAVLPVIVATAAAGFFLYRATVYGSLPTYENELFRVLDWSAFDWVRRPFEHAVLTSWSLSEVLMGQPNESLGLWMGLLWIPIVFGMAEHVRRKHFVLVFMFLAYCLPIMLLRDMLPRYLLPVAPLVLLFFFDGVRDCCRRIPPFRPSAAVVPLVLAWMAICCHLPKTMGHWADIHFGEDCHRELEEAHKDVAGFLRANAQEGDRFLSSAFHRNLSYRSGVWSLPVAKRRHENAGEEFDYWKTRQVRFFVVFDKEFCRHRHYMQMYWHYDMMNDEFLQSKGLHVVFQREGCRVYSE